MKFRLLLLLPLSFALSRAQAPDGEALCRMAETALFQHRVGESRTLLEQAVHSLPAGKPRGEAQASLAVLAWRYDRDSGEAARRLAAAAGDLPAWRIALLEARWRREEGDWPGALTRCREALAKADGDEARRAASKEAYRVLPLVLAPGGRSLDPSDLEFLRGLASAMPAQDMRSRVEWHEFLDLALLVGDADGFLEAWSALVPHDKEGVGCEAEPRIRGLLQASGAKGWCLGDPGGLVQVLADCRLHPEAAWLARSRQVDSNTARDEQAYVQFIDSVRSKTDEYYRMSALGKADRGSWASGFEKAECELVGRLHPVAGAKPDLSRAGMKTELAKRFGAYINFGTTSGVYDLHMGHVVRDMAWTPSQYGHTLKGVFHLVVLDGEVSNGFESWLWDGRASHGGWAKPEAIYQWASDNRLGRKLWAAMMEKDPQDDWLKERVRLDALDAARPVDSPMGELQGLLRRLEEKGGASILARLKGEGLQGPALKRAFLEEVEKARFESSILAHEGRHALDRDSVWARLRLTFQWTKGLEYRAKLSEIALAPVPQLAFEGILVSNVGDSTPHGWADARVLEGLGTWAQAHAAEIPGFSRNRPPWLQLDLFSETQLRAAARSLDPWGSSKP